MNILDQIELDSRRLAQPISKLQREARQLLCLVRCIYTKPMIIVIEKPNPSIMATINHYIRTIFESTTVIFIGFNNKDQFKVDRIFNLDAIKSI